MIARFLFSAAALSLVAVPLSGAQAQAVEKPGSAYVQCDGQPDNVSDGETAARLLGAVTLLGIFAPPHESADSSKRKFGAEGVAACTSLLEGAKPEGNAKRRLGLIFGRAIHQIEAKNYQAAIDDVALARREATTAGFMSDSFFVRSRGRAFDQIESAALFRMGQLEDARAVGLRSASASPYSFVPLFSLPTYSEFIPTPSRAEEQVEEWRGRLVPALGDGRADRLELARRFGDAARIRDALIEFDAEQTPATNSSKLLAEAAVSHALAGDFTIAADRANAAKANMAKRKADGTPESDAAEVVELFDLYGIIDTAHGGDMKGARRLFSARSQWLSASLGSVLEVNRRLHEGAEKDELIGGLAHDADALWTEHVDTSRTALLAKDKDNKTLFSLVPAERPYSLYQAVAKNVWNTDRSKMILKTKADPAKNKMEVMFLYAVDPTVALDAYVLHAALIARSRGHQGFVFTPVLGDKILAAQFRTGNRGDKGFPPELFLDANAVIAQLSSIIPDPATRAR